ncbi:MAG: 2,3-bisphosphoglycerate-independent phosphoglycerate mutase [Clostridia bacterium]|nr:2,3-bisphosphoglycerate-independent phosphoglycerate mutase [Clostridia bacterium]
MKRPVCLIIMDGYGINPKDDGNAICAAHTPNLDKYFKECPYKLIAASGMDVGLPEGQMGNSEVGHTNIGAGRVVYQELTRITKSIADGDFFTNEAFLDAIAEVRKNNGTLHLYGLVSNGGVHSHNTHLYALLELAKREKVENVAVHCFMDGRDVSPTSGAGFLDELQAKIDEIGVGRIATVMGRYYAMDRDTQWDRVQKAYRAMVLGEGEKADNAAQCVRDSYEREVTDEFIVPTVISGDTIKDGDAVICFNFRPDRARELTRAVVDPDFSGFSDKRVNVKYICMTQYDKTMPNVTVAYKPQTLNNTFGQYISSKGLRQLRIAETTKYAHVTFFFNGGIEKEYEGEDRVLIPTPEVATFDLQPEMSAYPVCDAVVEKIKSGAYDAIIMNYANCDMVGHTGVFDAAKKAAEAVDECVGKTVEAVLSMGGIACITADHGNAEQMKDYETGEIFTAHTTNPVPFIVVGEDFSFRETPGRLADIAPTLLDLMGIEKPEEMEGESLRA